MLGSRQIVRRLFRRQRAFSSFNRDGFKAALFVMEGDACEALPSSPSARAVLEAGQPMMPLGTQSASNVSPQDGMPAAGQEAQGASSASVGDVATAANLAAIAPVSVGSASVETPSSSASRAFEEDCPHCKGNHRFAHTCGKKRRRSEVAPPEPRSSHRR